MNFDALGDSNAQFFIVSDSNITFSLAEILLLNGAQSSNIFWLAKSGLISVNSTSLTTRNIYGTLIASTAVTFASNSNIYGNIFAQGTNVTFAADTTINPTNVCYLKGTKILTEDGFVPIENLKIGDRVLSKGKIHNNDFVNVLDKYVSEPIVMVGHYTAPNLTSETQPICIKKNTFGENLPNEDLYVSPGHRIVLNGKLVLAKDLINGDTVYQDNTLISVEYYHLELNSHCSVVANGLLSESYLDFDTRNIFIQSDEIVAPVSISVV